MAKKSGQFTHGGSNGKNMTLLLRALLNIISYALLWFGLAAWLPESPLIALPSPVPAVCTIAGAALTIVLLVLNLFKPYAVRVK